MRWVGLFLTVVSCACGPRARPATPTPRERAAGILVERVTYGGVPAARMDRLVLLRTEAGAVRAALLPEAQGRSLGAGGRQPVAGGRGTARDVEHRAQGTGADGTGTEGTGADDAAIEAAVRGLFSTDPLLSPLDLDVDVDDGIVFLAGDVRSREAAARALLLSLEAPGARAVESRLTWVPLEDRIRLERRARGVGRGRTE